jgi:MarR family transcriptional regulator, organic hydroperoxide resistance regulator
MSISRTARRGARSKRKRAPDAASVLPPTVSRPALLQAGSDRRFRALVHDLLTISARMELVRAHLGARIGIGGPQYSVLAAVAHLQGDAGTSVGAVAKALHVSSAFIASETGKLAQRGLLDKRPNPRDRRGVLVSVSPAGRQAIGRVGAEIRAVNDLFFGALGGKSFAALSEAIAALVGSSRKAVAHINAASRSATARLHAAE